MADKEQNRELHRQARASIGAIQALAKLAAARRCRREISLAHKGVLFLGELPELTGIM